MVFETLLFSDACGARDSYYCGCSPCSCYSQLFQVIAVDLTICGLVAPVFFLVLFGSCDLPDPGGFCALPCYGGWG